MPKPQFASSISQSANNFFFLILYLKKTSLVKGPPSDGQRSLSYFSLTCSADFIMLSPHNNPAFLALIPPSFTSLNPFVTFFRPLQPHSSSHNWGKYENSRFNSDASGYTPISIKVARVNHVSWPAVHYGKPFCSWKFSLVHVHWNNGDHYFVRRCSRELSTQMAVKILKHEQAEQFHF